MCLYTLWYKANLRCRGSFVSFQCFHHIICLASLAYIFSGIHTSLVSNTLCLTPTPTHGTVKTPLTSAWRRPYSSLWYLQRQATQPFEDINTVADIISYSALSHGSIKALGMRDSISVVEEVKEVTKVIDGKEVGKEVLRTQ